MTPRFRLAAVLLIATSGQATADGDPAEGERVFKRCKACHTVEAGGRSRVGPNLHGIVGAPAARSDGFRYSPAFLARAEEGLRWTPDNLRLFLENPQKFIGQSKMVLKLTEAQDREDVIAYLSSLSDE
jgi:cytochrome c